jgi:two-component system OmpR family sensor kinase
MTIDRLRTRLTVFWLVVLAFALVSVGGLIYALLARALYTRIDDNLRAALQVTATSLANDLDEGQDVEDAARSTAAELSSRQQLVAIFDVQGRLLAEGGRDSDLQLAVGPTARLSALEPVLETVIEARDDDDRHRLAMQRIVIAGAGVTYLVVVGTSLESTDEELESLREIVAYVVPLALVLAGFGGWVLARKGLAPIALMAARARRLGADDLGARLPVVNPRDELGQLAVTFNELLDRLEASMTQQRTFMADASHELRTPITVARTAAAVALQRGHRDESEYREALAIVEQQTTRLSRIVEDMFTLARADAGSYPVRTAPMYLDETFDEVVRAARVIAGTRRIAVAFETVESAAFTGDEDLLRRLLTNLLDNAIRHAPEGATVTVALRRDGDGYALSVTNPGPPIPPDGRQHLFERFYRADPARGAAEGGAGLGLALAQWVANAHGGEVTLVASDEEATTFSARRVGR